MKKLFKYLLIIIVSLILLIAIAIGSIILFVNPNNYKNAISKQVLKATGRTLTINGDMKWSFYPWLGIAINDASISNAPGFNDEPFAKLGLAQASVKLVPLFSGKIETDTLTLEDVDVNLSKNAQGQTNWQDLSEKPETTKTTATTTPTQNKEQNNLSLLVGKVSIKNTNIHWQNAMEHSQKTFTISQLESSNVNLDGSEFPLTLSLALQNANTKQAIKLSLDTKLMLNLAQQSADLSDMKLSLNNMKATGDMHAKNIFSDSLSYEANITIPNFNAADLLESLDSNVHFNNASALSNVSLSTKLNGTSNSLSLQNITAKIDDSSLSANANINNLQKLIGNFALNIDTLNIDNYKMAAPSANTTATNPNTNSTITTQAVVSKQSYQMPMAYANLNGSINVKNLIVAKVALSDVNAAIRIKQGVFSIGPMTATSYNGHLRANLVADYTNPTPNYRINETLAGIQINPLLNAVNGSSRISGTANINANLTANGNDNTAILRSLSGNAGFSVQNGNVQGFKIMQALQNAAANFFRQASSDADGQSTAFTSTAATFNITNGVASTNDLMLNSPMLSVTGSGSIDLVTEHLDMSLDVTTISNLIPAVARLQKQIGGSIPLKVGGTLSNPHISPDMKVITVKAATQKVGTQVQKIADDLHKSGKDIGNQLKALFN